MSSENFIDLRNIIGVRFGCSSDAGKLSLRKDDFTTDENLRWFIANHVHKETDLFADVEKDRAALYSVLSKFFTEDLPRISEIMKRRKMTFEFEIKSSDGGMD